MRLLNIGLIGSILWRSKVTGFILIFKAGENASDKNKKENHFENIMISKDLAAILSRISFWDSKVTLNNKTLKNFNVSLQNQFSKDKNKFKIQKQRRT